MACPKGDEGSFLLGVSENKLLLDGIPLETGQAERSFAQLLTTAGLASIHFSNQVTKEEFIQLVRAFAMGGSRAQDVVKEIKNTFGDSKTRLDPHQRSQVCGCRSVHRRGQHCSPDCGPDAGPGIQAVAE